MKRMLYALIASALLFGLPASPAHAGTPPAEYTLYDGTGWLDQYPADWGGPVGVVNFTPNGIDGYWALRVREVCDTSPQSYTAQAQVEVDRWYGAPYNGWKMWQYFIASPSATSDNGVEVDDIYYYHNPGFSQKIDGHNSMRIVVEMPTPQVYYTGDTCKIAGQVWIKTSNGKANDWWWRHRG